MGKGRKRTPLFDPSVIATKSPSMNDIHWLAGFYEGSGSCSIIAGQFTLQIGQANREPLDKVKQLFGGKMYEGNHPTSEKIYTWKVNYERAEGIAFTIFTLLSQEKRDRIVINLRRYRALTEINKLVGELGAI